MAEQSKEANLEIVDTHAHIFERGLRLAEPRRYTPNYDASLGNYLSMLDAHGIAHGVLIQPSFLGTDNSYMLAGLQQCPQRLRGIAVVDPTLSSGELERLNAAGVVGVRLNLIGASLPDFTIAPWPEFFRRVKSLGWQVEVHRHARDLPAILPPLLNAGVNIVVDHFGRPDPALGIEDPGFRFLLDTGPTNRVWVKLSAAYRNGTGAAGELTAIAAIPLLLSAFGAERLMWGSDWPHTQFEKIAGYGHTRALLDDWLPDYAVRRAVLMDTPASLYRFE